MRKIILASGSPRRKELMMLLPITFEVITEEIEEKIDERLSPWENVCDLAYQKAQAVANKYTHEWVIGCDTVVVYKGQILGKPKDEDDAKRTLAMLSGNKHEVYTGVSIVNQVTQTIKQFYVCSDVFVKCLSDAEIDAYVLTREPMDKAGSYGIQGKGSVFIEKIQGDYFNIVGLPVSKIYDELKLLGLISQ